MSCIGSAVSSISRFAKCRRWVCATASGEAPTWRVNNRLRCRLVTPSRSASCSMSASSSAPVAIRRRPRRTVVEVPLHAGEPGAVSGRQRRQGR